jgi:hypothetical protein
MTFQAIVFGVKLKSKSKMDAMLTNTAKCAICKLMVFTEVYKCHE